MNNFILINRTYSEITPESCEQSDFSDRGFIEQDEQITFSELVSLLREFNKPSQYPNNGDTHVWYSTGFYTSDYSTATEREECIHYSRNNTPNIEKYWKLAAKIAASK